MNNTLSPNCKCPCHSEKSYEVCCAPYHKGKNPENALLLMRSRYAAYALGLADYILQTTHPQNPQIFTRDQILSFCRITTFVGLDILSFEDGENIAYVTFTAHLQQEGKDASFTEKSLFEKVEGKWLYSLHLKVGVLP